MSEKMCLTSVENFNRFTETSDFKIRVTVNTRSEALVSSAVFEILQMHEIYVYGLDLLPGF